MSVSRRDDAHLDPVSTRYDVPVVQRAFSRAAEVERELQRKRDRLDLHASLIGSALHNGAAARFRVDSGTSRRDAAWPRGAGARRGHQERA